MKSLIIILISIGLLWNFQSSIAAYKKVPMASFEKEEVPSKNNLESEDFEVANHSAFEFLTSKYISKNIDNKNYLTPLSFAVGVITPPPNFS